MGRELSLNPADDDGPRGGDVAGYGGPDVPVYDLPAGTDSGAIRSQFLSASIERVEVGGSLRGGSASESGRIAVRVLGSAKIGGDIVGGNASGDTYLVESGCVRSERLGRLVVGGSLIAGVNRTTNEFHDNGAIRVQQDVCAIEIKGSLIGNSTNAVVIAAALDLPRTEERGRTRTSFQVETRTYFDAVVCPCSIVEIVLREVVIRVPVVESFQEQINVRATLDRLTVGGKVVHAQILTGPDAQVGTILVGGDWIASSISAGLDAGLDGQFGTADDELQPNDDNIVGRISEIIIQGRLTGTPPKQNNTDHFAFLAGEIGSMRIKGQAIALFVGPGNDYRPLGDTGDVRLREVT